MTGRGDQRFVAEYPVRHFYSLLLILLVFATAHWLFANSGGIINRSGSPGDGSSCSACHSGGSFTTSLTLTGLPSYYTPASTYTLSISVSSGGRHGFGLTSEKSGGVKVGAFLSTSNVTVSGANVYHSTSLTTNPGVWTFSWVAPSSGTGTVTFYAAGNVADNNGGTGGDSVVTASFAVSENPATASTSTVVSTGGVMNAGSTTLTVDAGVSVRTVSLAGGATRQIFTSTATELSTAMYGNGFCLRLNAGEAQAEASSSGLVASSTQAVIIVGPDNFKFTQSPGTFTYADTGSALTVSVSTASTQDLEVLIPTGSARGIKITLEAGGPSPSSGGAPGAGVIEIPAAAFAQSASVRCVAVSVPPAVRSSSVKAASVGSTGIAFSQTKGSDPLRRITIKLPFRNEDVAGLDLSSLVIGFFDEASQSWGVLPTTLDTFNRVLTGATLRLGSFRILSVSAAQNLLAPRVFPNPFRPAQGHTRMTFADLPVGATVKIYTLLGARVRELSADSTGRAFWDGRNANGLDAGSDTYLAIVESGGVKKTLKIGVQR